MKTSPSWPHTLRRLLRSTKAQALTEYALIMAMVAILCMFLYDPKNGIYLAIRQLYDTIAMYLLLPGP